MFWRQTNQDFNIRLVDVKNEKNNGLLAGVSLPPSLRAPRVSLAPKTPIPFPFKRLPRRLLETRLHSLKPNIAKNPFFSCSPFQYWLLLTAKAQNCLQLNHGKFGIKRKIKRRRSLKIWCQAPKHDPRSLGSFQKTYFQSLEFRLRGQYGGPNFFRAFPWPETTHKIPNVKVEFEKSVNINL